ncbi:TlpA family protein disulfide reductase [Solibacillus sp. FSL H8-0538]|uniref:TlpA family protein disulfide reductase n=1 Tax=Solibacillus sp. FSL H8-0538 TaxID=2921400 RepID=UPI0030FB1115
MASFSIGSLTIPTIWASVLLAYMVTKLINERILHQKNDWLGDFLFLYIVIWKLSYIVTDWAQFIRAPLSLLYFDGGILGHVLAVIVVTIQLYRKRKVKQSEGTAVFVTWFSFYLVMLFSYLLLQGNVVEGLVLVGLWLLLWKSQKTMSIILAVVTISSWFVFGQAIGSFTFLWGFVVLVLGTAQSHLVKQSIGKAIIVSMVMLVIINVVEKPIRETTTDGKAPLFTATTLTDEAWTLADYKGKTVILNFWASWCPPCKAEIPQLQSFHEEIPEDIVLLGVNLTHKEQDEGTVRSFVKGKMDFPIILDPTGEISKRYGVVTIPTTVIINPIGEIIYEHTGPVNRKQLEKLVQEAREIGR